MPRIARAVSSLSPAQQHPPGEPRARDVLLRRRRSGIPRLDGGMMGARRWRLLGCEVFVVAGERSLGRTLRRGKPAPKRGRVA
jgi:hypothetical protein